MTHRTLTFENLLVMNFCFLLGSGASVPAGFPKVAEITERVASDAQQSGFAPNSSDALSEGGRKLLRWLEIQIKRRYSSEGNRAVHYENLYFLAKQLNDDLLDEYDNPVLRPFIESAVEQVLPQTPSSQGSAYDELRELAAEVIKHIRGCLVASFPSDPTRLDHLHFIVEAIQQNGQSRPQIMTVNHDTLLEKVFAQIAFTDGFAKSPNCVGVREWQSGQLGKEAEDIRILKLHGGVDWHRFRPDGVQDCWSEDYIGIGTLTNGSTRDTKGRLHMPVEPIFLIGSWDKLARYTDPVYIEIYYAAFQALKRADTLVVVGYGFGDKGINKLITEWMCRSNKHRLVVVDRRIETLRQHARCAISNKWTNWVYGGQLLPIEFDLSAAGNLRWERIVESLG